MPADNLAQALLNVQRRNIRVTKDARANYGQYATLGTVIDALRDALNEEELVVTQLPTYVPTPDGRPGLLTQVQHAPSGETLSKVTPLVIDRDNMQGMGSALTYARRYSLVALFLIDADDDDDGQILAKSTPVTKEDAALEEAKEALIAALEAQNTYLDDSTANKMRASIRKATGLTAKELDDADAINSWLAANVR